MKGPSTQRYSGQTSAAAAKIDAPACPRVVFGVNHQHADAPHPVALLLARRERPRRRRADQRDELAAPCMSGKEHCEG